MFLDNGDLATGGEGEDLFAVDNEGDSPMAPVVITDFDTDEDMLAFTAANNFSVALSYSESYGAVVASSPDYVLAVLQGLSDADIPNISLVNLTAA